MNDAYITLGNGIKAEEHGFLKNPGIPDQEAQVSFAHFNQNENSLVERKIYIQSYQVAYRPETGLQITLLNYSSY